MSTLSDLQTNVSLNVAAKITTAEATTFINQSLKQIWSSFDWSFKKAEHPVATVLDYTTGTVDVTNGSGTLTGHSTVFTAAMVNRWLRVGSSGDIYKLTAYTSGTNMTMESPTGGTGYQGTTATLQAYTIFQHVFELASDVDHVNLPTRLSQIEPTTRENIDRIDPLRTAKGPQPSLWCPRELSSNNNYQIEFWPRPSVNGVIRVPYLKTPTALVNPTDESLLRGDVIEYLASHKAALYLLAKFGDEKYAALAQHFWKLYNGGKGDTEGGALIQAYKQDMEKYGMISHVQDRTRGPAYSDEFLASHDMSPLGGSGW